MYIIPLPIFFFLNIEKLFRDHQHSLACAFTIILKEEPVAPGDLGDTMDTLKAPVCAEKGVCM